MLAHPHPSVNRPGPEPAWAFAAVGRPDVIARSDERRIVLIDGAAFVRL